MQSSPTNSDLARRQASRFLGELSVSIEEQSGGLSGVRVWRVESSRGTFALRQYPVEFPTEERLRWLHRFLKEVRDRGSTLLPCPVAMADGSTWIRHESQLWEMLIWVHGEPTLEQQPTAELLVATATALAQLHQLLSQVRHEPLPEFAWINNQAAGLLERRDFLQQWFAHDEVQLREQFANKAYPTSITRLFAVQREALQKHGPRLHRQLEFASALAVPIFPVLRDLQPAHVLFRDSLVSGFIDVAALRPDSAAADLARLLQRWRYTQPAWYTAAVEAYNCVRPLSSNERSVLEAYDLSARLLTGVQWLRWIVGEQRQFESRIVSEYLPQLEQRLKELLMRETLDG